MENNDILKHEETGISLSELILLVKKNILMILIVTLVITLAGAVYGVKYKKPTYTASGSAVVLVGNSDQGNQYQNVLTAQYMLNTFKDYMSSSSVIIDVINSDKCKDYGLSVSGVSSSLTVTIESTNSLMLNVKYKSTNREEAIAVLNQILDSTYKLSNEGNVKDKLGDKFIILDYASDFNTVGSKGTVLIIIIACALGIILSLGIVLIKYLLDDTYTSKEVAERQLNINIIACLPNIAEEESAGKK